MRTKLTVLFASLVLLALTPLAYAQEPQSAADIMTFEDQFHCNDRFPHHSFCQAVEFKAWTPREKKLVREYLQNIRAPRLGKFLKTIQEKGITKLHRVSYGSIMSNNAAQRRVEFVRISDQGLIWVNPVTKVIGFADGFFDGVDFVDPLARIKRKQLNVLHELAHVFDIAQGHLSSQSSFQTAAGWQWDGTMRVLRDIDYKKIQSDFEEIRVLVKTDPESAYKKDRELGVQYGFPTLYGMMNTHESFAEALTYFILDPTAESYLSGDLIRYFKDVL